MTGRADLVWGCGDVDDVFHGGDRTGVPWRRLARRRRSTEELAAEQHTLRAFTARPPGLTQLDPRTLFASQPWVIRHHAGYYRTGQWERTGATSADMGSAFNRYPVVVIDAEGRHIIRAGHHRSLAALIAGRSVLARVLDLRGIGEPRDFGVSPAGPVTVVTPSLSVTSVDGHAVARAGIGDPVGEFGAETASALEDIRAGQRTTVTTLDVAARVLFELGLDRAQIDDRLSVATTGRARVAR